MCYGFETKQFAHIMCTLHTISATWHDLTKQHCGKQYRTTYAIVLIVRKNYQIDRVERVLCGGSMLVFINVHVFGGCGMVHMSHMSVSLLWVWHIISCGYGLCRCRLQKDRDGQD